VRQAAAQSGGILAPLRLGLFRTLWLANLISATGTMVQGVGAAWLMITLAGSPDKVALVQTATQAPIRRSVRGQKPRACRCSID
jgi:hypothetical protein